MNLFDDDDGQVHEAVLKSLSTTDQVVTEDIRILRKWMKEEDRFPDIMSNKLIKNLLILNKCNLEKTRQKIENYYTIRIKLDDIYKKSNPALSNVLQTMDIIYIVLHPHVIDNLYRMCFIKLRDLKLINKLDMYDVLRLTVNVVELRMQYDACTSSMFIVDCAGVNLSVVLKTTPAFIYKCLQILEKLYSSRIKAAYVINLPAIARPVLYILKKVMKQKLFERIYVCDTVEDLKQYFPDDFLPPDFGGTGFSLENLQEELKDEFKKHQQLFNHLDSLFHDERFLSLKK